MSALIGNWLAEATAKLTQAGIGTGRLDALILLEDVTGHDRAWLLAHQDTKINASDLAKLQKLLNRRLQHEPLAYLRGHTEFYGRDFKITQAVLEPRPESETMIELLKKLPGLPSPTYIADVGTGSGALGIIAALEMPNSYVELLEVDPDALKVAKTNVDKFTLKVNLQQSDLLSGSKQHNDVLLCNLPYVPDSFQINPAAMREPELAIFGGYDGLDVYRKLFKQVKNLSKQPLYILCEVLPPQHSKLTEIARQANYLNVNSEDFIVVFKSEKYKG